MTASTHTTPLHSNLVGGTSTEKSEQYVAFNLDDRSFCLGLSQVERVVFVAEITPLPKAPEVILGVINMGGNIIPVVNVRKRFRIPEREINLSDQLIIAHTKKRTVAMLVDAVTGVIEGPAGKIIAAEEILPGTEYIAGVIKLPDGMILVHDLDTFLSFEEEKIVDSSISDYRGVL